MITIRLKETGTKSRKQWRIVVLDKRMPRNGRLIEEIGFYNPLVEPPDIRVDQERYQAWVKKGARASKAVRALMKKVKKSGNAH